MKVVIASDSYKGSLDSEDVSKHIEIGLKRVFPNALVTRVPIGDGGEGTLKAVKALTGGYLKSVQVDYPNHSLGFADYLIMDSNTCMIEVSQATGLNQIGDVHILDRNSHGTGLLIKDALDNEINKIYLALGGSGTNDYGLGILHALGVRFLNENGGSVPPFPRYLEDIVKVDTTMLHKKFSKATFTILCDVTNPLYGCDGAAKIFGPQKGANLCDIKMLDRGAKNLSMILLSEGFPKYDMQPGSGAAGGIGFAIATIGTAFFESGIDAILNIANFDKLIEGADLVITGEGKIDSQSTKGKTPIGIAKRAKQYDIPTVAVVGSIGNDYREVFNHGIISLVSCVTYPQSIEHALRYTEENIENATERLMRNIKLGFSL